MQYHCQYPTTRAIQSYELDILNYLDDNTAIDILPVGIYVVM